MGKDGGIFLNNALITSRAFASLSEAALKMYIQMRRKCQMHKTKGNRKRKDAWIISNNGELIYTYSEAEKKGITRPRFKRGLRELVEKGFIDVTHQGGTRRGDFSTYGISDRWETWGTPEFIFKTMQKDTRKGRGFAVYWQRKKNN